MVMRKLYIALMALSVSLSASAQYEYWIGGTMDLGIGNTPGARYSESEKVLMFGPQIGYVASDVWEFGASVGFYHDRNIKSEYGAKYTEIKIAPFARFTFFENGDGWEKGDLSLFVQGQLGFDKIGCPVDHHTGSGGIKTYDRDLVTIGIGILPGIKYQISERIALVGTFGMIGYMNHTYKNNVPSNLSQPRNGGLDVTLDELGFDCYLDRDNSDNLIGRIDSNPSTDFDVRIRTQKCSEFIANVGSGLSMSIVYSF